MTATSFTESMKFEHKKKEEKKPMISKEKTQKRWGGQCKVASAQCTSDVKAAKRALRIQRAATAGMEYMGILYWWQASPLGHKVRGNFLLNLFMNTLSYKG